LSFLNFTLGFLCGSVSIALIWGLARTRDIRDEVRIISKIMSTLEENKHSNPEKVTMHKKPDNKAVEHYTSAEYKKERAFLEEVAARKARDSKFGDADYD